MTDLHIHAGAPSPRWQRRKKARPAEILDAAFSAFVDRGFAATRLEDVAKLAGCTKGTIFLYYESKEELFKAVIRSSIVPALERAEQIIAQHQGSARELLTAILRARFEGMTRTRLSGLPKLIFGEAGNFPDLARFYHDEVVARSQAMFERALRLGIASGEFRADLDVPYVARATTAPLIVAALWMHSFAPHAACHIDPERYFAAYLDVLFRGIASPDAPASETPHA